MVSAGISHNWYGRRSQPILTLPLSSLELSHQERSYDVQPIRSTDGQAEGPDAVGPWPKNKRQSNETKFPLLSTKTACSGNECPEATVRDHMASGESLG